MVNGWPGLSTTPCLSSQRRISSALEASVAHPDSSSRAQTTRQSQQDTTPTGTSATTYTSPYNWAMETSLLQPQFSPPAQGTLFTTPFNVSYDASYGERAMQGQEIDEISPGWPLEPFPMTSPTFWQPWTPCSNTALSSNSSVVN